MYFLLCMCWCVLFFFKHKTAYVMRISDWSSDVCSSDLSTRPARSARDESARPPGLACIVAALALPALIAAADERAQLRFLEFFAVAIRNPHTRRAYMRAAGEFLAWCEARGVASLAQVQPLHSAAWIEALGGRSEEHTSELQSLMRTSYDVFCL